jgi:hypothetical protein
VRSSRQRKYLESARLKVTRASATLAANPDLDDEDLHTLMEMEYAKEVARAMYTGGEFGYRQHDTLDDMLKFAKNASDQISKKDGIIQHLEERVEGLEKQVTENAIPGGRKAESLPPAPKPQKSLLQSILPGKR